MVENGNGKADPPHYLRSLVADTAGTVDKLCRDWADDYALVRQLLLGSSNALHGLPGTSLTLERGPLDMRVVVRTTRYGYEAEFHGKDLASILEQIENCLQTETMPWKPDWRRSKENRKRIDVV